MARALNQAGQIADHVEIWNLQSRLDRQLMPSRTASVVASRRLRRGLDHTGGYHAIFVVSPHRFSYKMLSYLRTRGRNLVALLGDDPIGPRSVAEECWALFDVVASADESWLTRVGTQCSTRRVMPWGSTLDDPQLLAAEPYGATSLVLVGAPYKERVAVAESLARRYDLVLQGDGWPAVPGARLRPSESREGTLYRVRSNRELVVNIHHSQFNAGRNPQFFDYAAAAIPQVVVYPNSLTQYSLGLSEPVCYDLFDDANLLANRELHEANRKLVANVRANYMFNACIERVLDEL